MHNEKLFTLIKAPIVTEKSARVGEELKQFVFKVDLSANKREIKQAVEKLFKVEGDTTLKQLNDVHNLHRLAWSFSRLLHLANRSEKAAGNKPL